MRKLFLIPILFIFTGCGSEAAAVLNGTAASDISEVLEDISVTDEMTETGNILIYLPYLPLEDAQFNSYGLVEAARRQFEETFDGWTATVKWSHQFSADKYGALIFDTEIDYAGDYFKNLPDIMSGTDASEDVPDIVGMRAADKARLTQEGLLEDMMPFFNSDPDFKIDGLLPGVVRAMSDGGALYSVPSLFVFSCLDVIAEEPLEIEGGDLPSPWNWDNAVKYFAPERERLELPWLIGMPPQDLLKTMTAEYYSYFYDETTGTYDFNSEVFKEILQTIKMLNDMELIGNIDYYLADYTYKKGFYTHGSLLRIFDRYDDVSDFALLKKQGYAKKHFPFPSLNSAEGVSISVFDEIAVNSQSKNKSAVWEFMKILMSDEVQNSTSNYAQPITADMTAAGINRAQLNYLSYELSDEELSAYNSGRQDYFAKTSVKTLLYGEPVGMDIIVRHAEKYFRGESELDEMIAVLQTETDENIGVRK